MHSSEFTDGRNGVTLELLLVEDSPGDVRLTRDAFRAANMAVHMDVASDGVEAMAFLRHEKAYAAAPRPDLILLDLNMTLRKAINCMPIATSASPYSWLRSKAW